MIRLKAHDKPINDFTEIDKFLLVPKKLWDDFKPGEISLKVDGKKKKLRVYEVHCECVSPKHTHRLIDLRETWDELGLTSNKEVEVSK